MKTVTRVHKYSVEEIAALRVQIERLITARRTGCDCTTYPEMRNVPNGKGGYFWVDAHCEHGLNGRSRFTAEPDDVERELLTLMRNGTTPEEVSVSVTVQANEFAAKRKARDDEYRAMQVAEAEKERDRMAFAEKVKDALTLLEEQKAAANKKASAKADDASSNPERITRPWWHL